jgi:L-lactate utilization protein LutC
MSFPLNVKKIFKNIREELFPKKKLPSSNLFEISKEDPIDVIFAKNLNNSGGKFFYCKDIQNLKKILEKLISHLEINKLYCSDNKLQNTFNLDSLTVKLDNKKNYQGIITNCEFIIADQGKVMLSSEQIQNKKISNLPKELIIISYTSQIVRRINDAMRSLTKKYKDKIPSNISTIGNGEKNINVIIIEDFKT